VLFQPRSKTMPVVVFLAVMFMVVALSLLLENVRPVARDPAVAREPELKGATPVTRRTA
jgi:hypothetical protein